MNAWIVVRFYDFSSARRLWNVYYDLALIIIAKVNE